MKPKITTVLFATFLILTAGCRTQNPAWGNSLSGCDPESVETIIIESCRKEPENPASALKLVRELQSDTPVFTNLLTLAARTEVPETDYCVPLMFYLAKVTFVQRGGNRVLGEINILGDGVTVEIRDRSETPRKFCVASNRELCLEVFNLILTRRPEMLHDTYSWLSKSDENKLLIKMLPWEHFPFALNKTKETQ